MNRKLLILALIVGGGVGIWKVIHERVTPSLATTEEFIAFGCDHAIADAETYEHIKLDYSIESLKQVDQILGHVHESYLKNPSSISLRGVSAEYGAYVGESIGRNQPNAYWTRDSKVVGEKTYPLRWKAGESYPIAWCSRRITNGDEDSIWIKYSVLNDPEWSHRESSIVVRAKQHSTEK